MTLTLISIGLNSHHDLSHRAIQAARTADKLYAEIYTMKLDTTPEELTEFIGKPVTPLTRGGMEEQADRLIEEAKTSEVAVLVGGDALSATTHISIILDAAKQGVTTKVIHGSSILSAIAETGLNLYKFGRTVTVPLPEKGPVDTVLRTLKENKEHGLHTLILLDLNIPKDRYLTVNQAIQRLQEAELPTDTLLVGVARLGSQNPVIKADTAEKLLTHDFGEAPHAIVAPGSLHFLEEEALRVLAECPPELLKNRKVQGEVDKLIEKYSKGCRKVLEELKVKDLPAEVTKADIKELLAHTGRYLDDAEYYWSEQKAVALTSVAYAEGILDALKLLGLIEFEW
ncbi:MAG: diphthine synthase [Candidatus Bathyarchaeota archaeon]|nr:diphthine synthase [Candidatus Bathyarchaeota archaeon]